jgi:hypothetical protein
VGQWSANKIPMPFRKPSDAELTRRYDYHAPQGDQAQRYQEIRQSCLILAHTVRDLTPCSPEQNRALNALDEVMFLANAAIARSEHVAREDVKT